MWTVNGPERLTPPPEYQDHVARIGGLNRFGEPNFRLVWGQTAFDYVWGEQNGVTGRHIVLKYGGIPAWHLEQWKPPECFGTPELWYALTWDPQTNMHICGEFPWRGVYMPCNFNLYVKRITGGGLYFDAHGDVCTRPQELHIDAMPLTFWVLDLLIPNVMKAIDETETQRISAMKAREEAERKQFAQKVFDVYSDATPAFGGVAGTYESNREAWEQRIKEKAAGLKISAEQIKRKMGKGHRQVPLDAILASQGKG